MLDLAFDTMPTEVGIYPKRSRAWLDSTRAIGVPSKLGTYRKCRLQGRHFRSGYAGRPVDADLGRRRLEKPRT
ncbi:hypothetical protein, partial [uncultured Stenotrophomonas sp.]|uniref:hypothetical protein n=1 Tax=uncultured Stenotrophomonas sp. TaxID=165438 RepID=UPI0025D01C43